MPPHHTRTLLATCSRCTARRTATPRWLLATSQNPAPQFVRSYAASSGTDKIIVLDPPRRRAPQYAVPPPSKDPLDNVALEGISKQLLTYEQEALLDMTRMEISLHKPQKLQVSARRWQQLHDQLMKCFSPPQLRNYYEHHMQEDAALPRLRKNMAKHKLVAAILGDLWKVEVAEEIAPREDYIVTKEIQSTPRDIFFLLTDDARLLRAWATRCSARISVNAATASLEIQASEASIERIEEFIRESLAKVVEEEVDLSVISRVGKFNPDFMAPISRTTRTFIEQKDENTLRISAVEPARDRLDDTRRLLIASVNMEFRAFSSLLYATPQDGSSAGALYPVAEDAALPWMFRGNDWQRWKNTKNKGSPQEYESPNLPTESIHSALHQLPGSMTQPGPSLLSTSYHAKLGHILHLLRSTGQELPRSVEEFAALEKSRVFCTTFPGLPFFTPYLENEGHTEGAALRFEESFILRFLPSPWADPANFDAYPTVQIILPADLPTGELGTPEIIAFQSKSIADVMLPNDYCDIRFERQEGLHLNIGATLPGSESRFSGVDSEEWFRYMGASRLDRYKNYKIRAAANLQIHVPHRLINGTRTEFTEESKPIDYMFAGMEYRQITSVVKDGITISRSAIEAGSGGRTTELRASFMPSEHELQDQGRMKLGFDNFVGQATDLVASLARWMRS